LKLNFFLQSILQLYELQSWMLTRWVYHIFIQIFVEFILLASSIDFKCRFHTVCFMIKSDLWIWILHWIVSWTIFPVLAIALRLQIFELARTFSQRKHILHVRWCFISCHLTLILNRGWSIIIAFHYWYSCIFSRIFSLLGS
jgi:hypothetical protein